MQGVKLFSSVLLFVCFVAILNVCYGQISVPNTINAPDVPNFQANLKNIPVGSLIIPMDEKQIHDNNALQSLLPYGLVIRTLWNNVSVSWAIATGKPLSGADFQASVKQAKFGAIKAAGLNAQPTSWSGWTGASTNLYYGGPFIILAQNVEKALKQWNSWTTGQSKEFISVQNTIYDNVAVHILTSPLTADIRHQINSRPFVAVSNLDGNAGTQTAMLGCIYQNATRLCDREDGSGWGSSFGNQAKTVPCGAFTPQDHAGLEFGIHYVTYDCGYQVTALTATTCLATFSEPHWSWTQSTGPEYLDHVKQFINSGANFIAQCASTYSYENSGGTQGTGTFLSTYGINDANAVNGINYDTNTQLQTVTNYPDLPVSQYVGPISSIVSGAVPDWYNLFSPNDATPSSWNGNQQPLSNGAYNNWNPNSFPIATNVYDSRSNTNYRGRNIVLAAGMKLNTNNPLGSNIFYIGGHTWTGLSTVGTDNGRRMLLNAILIPALRPPACGFSFCTPGQACTPLTACENCTCNSAGSGYIRTPINNGTCCLSNAGCYAPCQFCNLNLNQCQVKAGCCAPPTIPCGNCQTCNSSVCVSTAGCCINDADCKSTSKCVHCTGAACVRTPAPACCDSNTDCNTQTCFVCNNNSCSRQQPQSSCCLTTSDCNDPCLVCDVASTKCVAKPGCCKLDTDCGTSPCVQCTQQNNTAGLPANTCVRKDACCENDGQCPACTICANTTSSSVAAHTCVSTPDVSCCVTDADCGSCRRCAPGANSQQTCLTINDCCLTSADCEVCTNCTNSACTPIPGCCKFDADCGPCQLCEDYVCVDPPANLHCCLSDQECNDNAAILRVNGSANETVSPCAYTCQKTRSDDVTGQCGAVCTTPKSYTGLIVGLAVGIPLGLLALAALAAIIIFIIAKKRDALMTKFVRKSADMGGDAQSNPLHEPNVKVVNSPL